MSIWNSRTRATRLLLAVLLASVGVVAGLWFGVARMGSGLVPDDALAALLSTQFNDLQGTPTRLQDFSGKTLVVNFWATWCAPCKEEMPDLARFQTENVTNNVQIVGIGIDSVDNMQAFAKAHPVNYPLLSGTGATISLSRALGNASGALPYTLVINSAGKATYVKLGRISVQELESVVAAANASTR